jgi:hypothetical protein
MLKFKNLPKSKQRFYIENEDGSVKLNLDLTKVYTHIDSENTFFARGFERTLLEKKKFKTKAEANKYEENFWFDMKKLLKLNNKLINKLYFNNPAKIKIIGMAITKEQKEFFEENKQHGYHL